MAMRPEIGDIFERRLVYPNVEAKERFERLVGLDYQKSELTKMLGILVNPAGLASWFDRNHPNARELLKAILRRPPLVALAGDVGTGKTELAETVGDAVARQEDIYLTLFPLSLSTRGQGRVGEMTQLLTSAFDYTYEAARKL